MRLGAFLAELDDHAGPVPLDRITRLEKRLRLPLEDVREHVRFADAQYARNLLRTGRGYQAWILCWRPGQRSPIHDHRGSSCGVLVLQGAVTEQIFLRGEDGRLVEGPRTVLPEGDVCGSYDTDIHEIANRGDEDLVTLHVYSPALVTMGIYRRESAEVTLWTP